MTEYRCIAVDTSGQRKIFFKRAANRQEVERSFSSGGWYLISIQEVNANGKIQGKRRYSEKTIKEFTELTAVLLESGLTLKDALSVEKEISQEKGIQDLVEDLLVSINKGFSFVQAIEACGDAFPTLYKGMMRIGDKTGSVEKMFPKLAEYLDGKKKIKDQILGALAYPALVLSMTVVGVVCIIKFLLPNLVELFKGLNADAANSLVANAANMKNTLTSFLVLIVAIIVLKPCISYFRKHNGLFALRLDELTLRIPGVGSITKKYQTMNFSFAMEVLLSGGIPLETALDESKFVVGNMAYRHAIEAVRDDIIKGEALSSACLSRKEFPHYVSQWIAVGERSGNAKTAFAQIRKYYQSDVERLTARAMSILEPVLILIVGGILIWVIVSFILPLFTIYGSIV